MMVGRRETDMEENAPDEGTLALLIAVSELTGHKHGANEVVSIYKRSLEKAEERLKDGEQHYTHVGF